MCVVQGVCFSVFVLFYSNSSANGIFLTCCEPMNECFACFTVFRVVSEMLVEQFMRSHQATHNFIRPKLLPVCGCCH